MPDDLPSLATLMNSNNETTSVAASNRVTEVYGARGLLQVLDTGGATARGMAAIKLARFPRKEVEVALTRLLKKGDKPHVRISALSTLKEIGTDAALPVVDDAESDPDESVAAMARVAANTIRSRAEGKR